MICALRLWNEGGLDARNGAILGFSRAEMSGYYDDIVEFSELKDFLDVPVNLAVARVRSRPEEKDRYINMKLQYALREEYINICKENDGILVSTGIGEDCTYQKIITKVKEVLNGKSSY